MCLKFLFTVNVQLGFLLIALIWKFDFSPFMILVIAILNDGKFAVQLQRHTGCTLFTNFCAFNTYYSEEICYDFRHYHDYRKGQSKTVATP